jgi:hypothetical protein
VVAGFAAVLALVLLASGAGAAAIAFHSHDSGTDTFPDQVCGIDGTSVSSFVDNTQIFADNTFKDQNKSDTVFTSAATGKSVELSNADQQSGSIDPIDNGNGTVTFVFTYKGLPEKIKLPNGRVLSRDAGTLTISNTFDASTGDFISQTFSNEHGPHPDADSGFNLFCDVIVPALS